MIKGRAAERVQHKNILEKRVSWARDYFLTLRDNATSENVLKSSCDTKNRSQNEVSTPFLHSEVIRQVTNLLTLKQCKIVNNKFCFLLLSHLRMRDTKTLAPTSECNR